MHTCENIYINNMANERNEGLKSSTGREGVFTGRKLEDSQGRLLALISRIRGPYLTPARSEGVHIGLSLAVERCVSNVLYI